jgi:hypothetical protein
LSARDRTYAVMVPARALPDPWSSPLEPESVQVLPAVPFEPPNEVLQFPLAILRRTGDSIVCATINAFALTVAGHKAFEKLWAWIESRANAGNIWIVDWLSDRADYNNLSGLASEFWLWLGRWIRNYRRYVSASAPHPDQMLCG